MRNKKQNGGTAGAHQRVCAKGRKSDEKRVRERERELVGERQRGKDRECVCFCCFDYALHHRHHHHHQLCPHCPVLRTIASLQYMREQCKMFRSSRAWDTPPYWPIKPIQGAQNVSTYPRAPTRQPSPPIHSKHLPFYFEQCERFEQLVDASCVWFGNVKKCGRKMCSLAQISSAQKKNGIVKRITIMSWFWFGLVEFCKKESPPWTQHLPLPA